MSEADEKRYSAKEICDVLGTVAVVIENETEAGKDCENAINAFCHVFLGELLGEELYHQAIKELTQEMLARMPGPEAAILAAMKVAAGGTTMWLVTYEDIEGMKHTRAFDTFDGAVEFLEKVGGWLHKATGEMIELEEEGHAGA